jgi:hypothetical protein
MDINQRLELQQMCRENNVTDQTELMRQLKHSSTIRKEIDIIIQRRRDVFGTDTNPDPEQLKTLKFQLMSECEFLFTYYTDIFNRVVKEEVDLTMLYTFLDMLKEIEEGNQDQHEASFKIGTLLKEMYIDSALKTANNLDKKYGTEETPEVKLTPITWSEYKKNQNL